MAILLLSTGLKILRPGSRRSYGASTVALQLVWKTTQNFRTQPGLAFTLILINPSEDSGSLLGLALGFCLGLGFARSLRFGLRPRMHTHVGCLGLVLLVAIHQRCHHLAKLHIPSPRCQAGLQAQNEVASLYRIELTVVICGLPPRLLGLLSHRTRTAPCPSPGPRGAVLT